MIEPRARDIGRAVIYRPKFSPPETGTITSYNDKYVFVRYQNQFGLTGQATRREDFEWVDEKK